MERVGVIGFVVCLGVCGGLAGVEDGVGLETEGQKSRGVICI